MRLDVERGTGKFSTSVSRPQTRRQPLNLPFAENKQKLTNYASRFLVVGPPGRLLKKAKNRLLTRAAQLPTHAFATTYVRPSAFPYARSSSVKSSLASG
jgi:hypothetical protein